MLLPIPNNGSRGDGAGISWPESGTATPGQVGHVFGPRLFPYHLITIGYDYDFHRGIDLPDTVIFYSPINGSVIRKSETMFGFEDAEQLDRFTEVDPSSSATFTHTTDALRITGLRVGAVTLANAARFVANNPLSFMKLDEDWVIEINLASTISIVGRVGVAMSNPGVTEYAAIEYDGTNVYMFGVDAGGAMTPDGTSVAVAGALWLRLAYTASTTTLRWQTSVDGSTFTTRGSDVAAAFTNPTVPAYLPWVYWRSVDTAGGTQVVDVAEFNWADGQTISRFGNWLMIATDTFTFEIAHFQQIFEDIPLGTRVYAGQPIGIAGKTGFDTNSGRVLTKHAHVEYIPGNAYIYSNLNPVNPLNPGYFPRSNTTSNVSVVRTRENDPNGNDSWRLQVTVLRDDQNFDLNSISLTGDSGTRTINFNTRGGIDPANNDVPIYDGVYITATTFNSGAVAYVVNFYFNTATVGTTFVSFTCLDTQGIVVASG